MADAQRRRIGPVLATVLVANNMIGSGIFLLPATLATVGGITIVGWIAAMLGALLVAAVLARLGQYAPASGGPCTYALEAFGRYIGFQASVLYWLSCWTANVAIAVAATGYLASLLHALQAPVTAACATALLIVLATWVNLRGPRFVAQLQGGALLLGLVPILLVATLGWAWFQPEVFRQSWNVQHQPLLDVVPGSIVLVFWAFTGLESASVAADVVDNPRRNVPIATVGGVFLAGIIYIAASTAILGLIPAATLARSTAPFADAVRIMLGPLAGTLVAVMALAKTLGTLTGWVLITTETGSAAAERQLFPAFFARRNAKGIATTNLLVMGAIACAVVFMSISPTLGSQFGMLIEVATIAVLIVYVYACLSIWHYGARGAKELLTLRYRVAAIVAASFCLLVIAMSERRYILLSAGIMLATVPAWWLLRRRN